jgi:hypothetical protein
VKVATMTGEKRTFLYKAPTTDRLFMRKQYYFER